MKTGLGSVPEQGRALLRGGWWLLVLSAFAVALALRHAVVEPAEFAHGCDPNPWTGWCAPRTLLLQTFVEQRVGWLALAAGVGALCSRRAPRLQRWLVRVALVCGCAGLILYSYEPSAVGVLLAALSLIGMPNRSSP